MLQMFYLIHSQTYAYYSCIRLVFTISRSLRTVIFLHYHRQYIRSYVYWALGQTIDISPRFIFPVYYRYHRLDCYELISRSELSCA